MKLEEFFINHVLINGEKPNIRDFDKTLIKAYDIAEREGIKNPVKIVKGRGPHTLQLHPRVKEIMNSDRFTSQTTDTDT